jgi:hypothetical protein
MKIIKKILVLSLVVLFAASCSSTLNQRQVSDDLYGTTDQEKVAQESENEEFNEEMTAKANDFIQDESSEKEDTTIYENNESSNPYERILVDNYDEAYNKRIEGMMDPYYRMPNNFSVYYSDAYWHASAFDPAFYNVMVMGDQVWVEPNWVSSMFGYTHNFNYAYRYSPYYRHYNHFNPYSFSYGLGYYGNPYYSYGNYSYNMGFSYGLGVANGLYYGNYYGSYYNNPYNNRGESRVYKRKDVNTNGGFKVTTDDSQTRPVRESGVRANVPRKSYSGEKNRPDRKAKEEVSRKSVERKEFTGRYTREGDSKYISVKRPDNEKPTREKFDRKYIRPVDIDNDKDRKSSFNRISRSKKARFNENSDFTKYKRSDARKKSNRSVLNLQRRPSSSGNLQQIKERMRKRNNNNSNSSSKRSSFSPSRSSGSYNNSSSGSGNSSSNVSRKSGSSSSSSSSRPSRK